MNLYNAHVSPGRILKNENVFIVFIVFDFLKTTLSPLHAGKHKLQTVQFENISF